jgi:hypothetical protein
MPMAASRAWYSLSTKRLRHHSTLCWIDWGSVSPRDLTRADAAAAAAP